MKLNRSFFRYFAYALEIIVLYILQGTPNLIPELFGSKPLLLIPVAITIAAKENKIPSLIFGAVCGLMTDMGTGGSIGFFAVLMTVLCYAQAHIFKKYLVASFATVMIVSVIIIPCVISLYFLIFTVFAGIDDCGYMFVNHYISRIAYTFVSVVPIYFLNSFISKNLRE